MRNQKIKILAALDTRDAFIHKSLIQSLRDVCNLLGEPMPDPSLLGKDRDQPPLGL